MKIITIIFALTISLISCYQLSDAEKIEVLLKQVEELEKNKEFNKAIDVISNAIQIDSTNSSLYVLRGRLNIDFGNLSAALKDLNHAIEKKPDNVLAHYYRGNVYYAIEKPDSALQAYNRAISLKEVGSVYFDLKNEEMRGYGQQSDVEMKQLRFFRALSLYDLDKDEEALPDFEFSLAKGYEPGECYGHIGSIYLNKDNYEYGCKMLAEGVSLKDSMSIYYYGKYCR